MDAACLTEKSRFSLAQASVFYKLSKAKEQVTGRCPQGWYTLNMFKVFKVRQLSQE